MMARSDSSQLPRRTPARFRSRDGATQTAANQEDEWTRIKAVQSSANRDERSLRESRKTTDQQSSHSGNERDQNPDRDLFFLCMSCSPMSSLKKKNSPAPTALRSGRTDRVASTVANSCRLVA